MIKTCTLLFILLISAEGLAQTRLIQGTVYDADDLNHISNVNILVIEDSTGTITDEKGNFQINVKRIPAILQFSHVGYSIINYSVTESDTAEIEIYLIPELTSIDEVSVTAEIIHKISLGDTLNVLDYIICEERILIAASPYKQTSTNGIYLADLHGNIINNLASDKLGRKIKIPEIFTPVNMYLYEDYNGTIYAFTKNQIKQIYFEDDSLRFKQIIDHPIFHKNHLSIKVKIGSNYFYQLSNKYYNRTYLANSDGDQKPKMIKSVFDPQGETRYIYYKVPNKSKLCYKYVSAPLVGNEDEILIFDFFDNNIEVFDSLGISKRLVPINFHEIDYKYFFRLFEATSLNIKEFHQEILIDKVTGKIYALFHQLGKRAKIKEIDKYSGNINREIEIPDFPSIDNIKIHNNVVYFTYQVKTYPRYNTLFKMSF